jgi:hypothetical protein
MQGFANWRRADLEPSSQLFDSEAVTRRELPVDDGFVYRAERAFRDSPIAAIERLSFDGRSRSDHPHRR